MSLGDQMFAQAQASASAQGTPLAVDDDEQFIDDGLSASSDDKGGVSLTPVGEVLRPNGVKYKPRTLFGYEDCAFIRHCRTQKQHPLLYGEPGTGKTALSEAAFFQDAVTRHDPQLNRDIYVHVGMESIICSADTTEADFFGTWIQDPINDRFVWAPGPLHRAVMHDIPLYVDEIFLANPLALTSALYPVMDGRNVLHITANPHLPPLPIGPGFFVIGSGNPNVIGAVFSDALRDRFTHHIEVETDWALAKDLGVPGDIVTVAKNLDKNRKTNGGWAPQLRTLLAYRDAVTAFGRNYALANLVSKAPIDARPELQSALHKKFNLTVEPLTLGARHGR